MMIENVLQFLRLLAETGQLTGTDLRFEGAPILPEGDDRLEESTGITYNAYGLSEPDEHGLVRIRDVDEVVIPKVREEFGDAWAEKVPQFFGLYPDRLSDLGYTTDGLQRTRLAINGEYAYFTGTPLTLFRRLNAPSKPGRRVEYAGMVPNARFVRDDEATAESIAQTVLNIITDQYQRQQNPPAVDFSPR